MEFEISHFCNETGSSPMEFEYSTNVATAKKCRRRLHFEYIAVPEFELYDSGFYDENDPKMFSTTDSFILASCTQSDSTDNQRDETDMEVDEIRIPEIRTDITSTPRADTEDSPNISSRNIIKKLKF